MRAALRPLLAILLAAPPAAAETLTSEPAPEDPPQPRADGPGEGDRDFGHGMQFGLRATVLSGLRMIFRYDTSPYCKEPDLTKPSKDQSKSCGHRMPTALDLALSFAPVDAVEPFLWLRAGLAGEPQTNTDAVLAVGAGARIYTMADSAFKIAVSPAVAYSLEGTSGNPIWTTASPPYDPEWKKDLLFRFGVAPHYDFARAFGLYADVGITVGVLRALSAAIEGGIGLQLRFP